MLIKSKIFSDLETKIHEWTTKKSHETWPDLIEKLLDQLHPNHYLVFGLKKTLIGKPSRPMSNIEDLEQRLKYCQDVLEVLSKLDPGLTMQRALILKITAQTRSELIKDLASKAKSEQEENEGKGSSSSHDLTLMAQQALQEFRESALCLKCPKP